MFKLMARALVILSFCLLISDHAKASPTVYPDRLTINKPLKTYSGYTIYASPVAKKVFLLDMEGKEVHTWQHKTEGFPITGNPKPLPNGNILAHYRTEKNTDKDKKLVELDWNGNIVWEFYNPDHNFLHHDVEKEPDGNYLMIGATFHEVPSLSKYTVRDDYIIEVNPNGEIIWEWLTSDHFDEFGFSPEAREIIYNGVPYDKRHADVFHSNSIQSLPPNKHWDRGDTRFRPGNILVSQRNTNILFIIDKETKHIVWKLGPENSITVGQHHASMIPKGLEGEGNILVFDNGGKAGYPPLYRFYSRVIEINPQKKQSVWEYTASKSGLPSWSFLSRYMGSAERLPNGNTLICEAMLGRIFEVNRDGKIVWEYINPYQGKGDSSRQIYRSYRVDPNWPSGPLDK